MARKQTAKTAVLDVLLLDPNVRKNEIYKQNWQKQTSLQRHVHGWMRKWELVNVEGAAPSMPNFEELCAAACKGLPERQHELRAWGHKASCSMSTARDCIKKQPLKMARLRRSSKVGLGPPALPAG